MKKGTKNLKSCSGVCLVSFSVLFPVVVFVDKPSSLVELISYSCMCVNWPRVSVVDLACRIELDWLSRG